MPEFNKNLVFSINNSQTFVYYLSDYFKYEISNNFTKSKSKFII